MTEVSQAQGTSVEKASLWLEHLLDEMGIPSSVNAVGGNEAVTVRIENATEPELLIGPKGQTLDALQYLLNAAFMGQLGKRLVLDVGDYREQRMAKLVESAHDAADRVRLTARTFKFPPMGSADRRIVHTVLLEYPDLTTQSEGEDPYRYVVLSPHARGGRGPSKPASRPSSGRPSHRPRR